MDQQEENKACLERNAEAVRDFLAFDKSISDGSGLTPEDLEWFGPEPFDEVHYEHLMIGYFLGKGCSLRDSFLLAYIVPA